MTGRCIGTALVLLGAHAAVAGPVLRHAHPVPGSYVVVLADEAAPAARS